MNDMVGHNGGPKLTDAQIVAIEQTIRADIDQFCVNTYFDGFRKHLGGSVIGRPCLRDLFYGFRWFRLKVESGQQYRLFNRGHKEEERYIEWLRGIGFNIVDVTEDGKQVRIAAHEGHFGGSLDGLGSVPAKYQAMGLPPRILLEFKTYNEKSFKKLIKDRVKIAKPEHYAQMCVYGYKHGLRYALYCPICKNNDEIFPQIIELDWTYGAELIDKKALEVITARKPPPRISEDRTSFQCKFCDHIGPCHFGERPHTNCRSCRFSYPAQGGTWVCEKYGTIPDNVIRQGCGDHDPIS